MTPYGRLKKVKGNGRWKTDYHPPKGYINWWETIADYLDRGRINQLVRKDIEKELNEI